jgi:hypothetical protein
LKGAKLWAESLALAINRRVSDCFPDSTLGLVGETPQLMRIEKLSIAGGGHGFGLLHTYVITGTHFGQNFYLFGDAGAFKRKSSPASSIAPGDGLTR